jgi:hypothetical protein
MKPNFLPRLGVTYIKKKKNTSPVVSQEIQSSISCFEINEIVSFHG